MPRVRGTPGRPITVTTRVMGNRKIEIARARSVIVPEPAKRKIERYTPSARKMGGQIKNDAIKTLRIGAFQSCQSPKRREKASQIAAAHMIESAKNAMIFLARRSRFDTADKLAIIADDTLSTGSLRLRIFFMNFPSHRNILFKATYI